MAKLSSTSSVKLLWKQDTITRKIKRHSGALEDAVKILLVR
jgi:hypothetical protein